MTTIIQLLIALMQPKPRKPWLPCWVILTILFLYLCMVLLPREPTLRQFIVELIAKAFRL